MVEDVLFKAFVKARLVEEDGGLDGCGWGKCGRTDRGVSAAGQVVSLWVRSALPAQTPPNDIQSEASSSGGVRSESASSLFTTEDEDIDVLDDLPMDAVEVTPQNTSAPSQSSSRRELRYVSILNRVLPPTIRVLAWSPISPDFSARFNCKHRHYKYFFTSHGLDIPLMQSAAARVVGEHDFRNMCKLDPGKQITNFHRCVVSAQISPVSDDDKQLYAFGLIGSAFLYLLPSSPAHHGRPFPCRHRTGAAIRHLSSSKRLPRGIPRLAIAAASPLVDRKPEYQMADALPGNTLVLLPLAFVELHLMPADDVAALVSHATRQTIDDLARSRVYRILETFNRSNLVLPALVGTSFLLQTSDSSLGDYIDLTLGDMVASGENVDIFISFLLGVS